jgi:hypothetical protein
LYYRDQEIEYRRQTQVTPTQHHKIKYFCSLMVILERYFCNGVDSRDTPYETWSSSKIFAMANAGGKLRTECAAAGLDASTTGHIAL